MQGSGDPRFEKPQRYLTINKIYYADTSHTHFHVLLLITATLR